MATLNISDLSVDDWVGIDQAELNMPSEIDVQLIGRYDNALQESLCR